MSAARFRPPDNLGGRVPLGLSVPGRIDPNESAWIASGSTDVNGLALSAKDNGHAYLASKTGFLAIALEQGGEGQEPAGVNRRVLLGTR